MPIASGGVLGTREALSRLVKGEREARRKEKFYSFGPLQLSFLKDIMSCLRRLA
jgi:hypothetical protein